MKTFRGSPAHLELERPLGESKLDYLVLQLDSNCPHTCTYCFVGSNLNQEPKGGNLSFEERKEVLQQASDLGARVVAMPGEGEPLATPRIRELIDFMDSKRIISIIYTKGYLLEPRITDFLAVHNTTVVISLDSLDEKTAMKLCPKPRDWFQKAIKNVEYARTIFSGLTENKGGCEIIRLVINHMVNQFNYGQQEGIRNWCGDDILFVCHGPSQEGYAEGCWKDLAGSSEQHRALIEYANRMSMTKGNTTARADGKCAYYLNGITVGSNGDVKTCPASTLTAGKIGNIRETTLEGLFDSTQSTLKAHFGSNLPQCLVRCDGYKALVYGLDSKGRNQIYPREKP